MKNSKNFYKRAVFTLVIFWFFKEFIKLFFYIKVEPQ